MAQNVSADWTLGRMAFQLESRIESYLLAHSSGYDASAAALADETAALGDPAAMMLGKEQYTLFTFLARLTRSRRALDVGTFTGLSALAFAQGMGPDGRVVSIDRNPAWIDFARRHWSAAGVGERIETRVGEALELLQALETAPEQCFDLVFLDVDKAHIQDYFEEALRVLRPSGLIMVDNTFWHGWVLDPQRTDADTRGMRDFNARIARDPRVEVAMLPIADGLSLIRRRG
jgi:predicted O-methyltransferase YrrM